MKKKRKKNLRELKIRLGNSNMLCDEKKRGRIKMEDRYADKKE